MREIVEIERVKRGRERGAVVPLSVAHGQARRPGRGLAWAGAGGPPGGRRPGVAAPATPKKSERGKRGEREVREGEKKEEGGLLPPSDHAQGARWAPWPPTAGGGAPAAPWLGVALGTPKKKGKNRRGVWVGDGEELWWWWRW